MTNVKLLTWQLNIQSNIRAPVIPAKAGIQQSQGIFWIPALRSAVAGMTSLFAGLIRNSIIFKERMIKTTERSDFYNYSIFIRH
jgi:hypothetical protein